MTTRPWTVLSIVSLGLFLAVMSTTVVSVALPTIARALDAGPAGLEWIVNAYVIVYAGLLVAGGVLGDRHGLKATFVLGVALFALGALVAGLAPSLGILLAGRVLQGLGPALLVPGSLAIVRATFEDERERATAIGLWSVSSGLALAAGPPLGGVIVDAAGWRWVFLATALAAGALAPAAAALVPRLPRSGGRGRFDWAGALLSTAAIVLLAFGCIDGQRHGFGAAPVLAAFAGGAAALGAFVAWERRAAEPLVDVALFARPAFVAANIAAFVIFFAFVGGIVYLSAYFQQVQGRSPAAAGVDVAAVGIALAVAAALAGRLVARAGERGPLLVGLLVSAAATLGLLRLGAHTPLAAIWWNLALLGAGIGLCGTPMSTIAMSAVDATRAGMASAVLNASRQVGQVFGVAVLGALVYAGLPGASGRLGPAVAARFVGGLHDALWLSGLLLLAAALVAVVAVRPGPRR